MTARRWGLVCLVGYVACIVAANYAISHWGTLAFPGGPHTVTLLGMTAPSGVLFVGLSFSFRDGVDAGLGRWTVVGAIVVGAALSALIAPNLALASGCAFLLGESADLALWAPLADRGRYVWALVASNTVGAAVDTAVFLWLAFSSLQFFWGQMGLKLLMTVPVLAVLLPLRWRRRQRAMAAA